MDKKGQSSVEYLLMVGAAVAIVVVLAVLVLSISGSSQGSFVAGWNPFEDFWAKIDIQSPTKETPSSGAAGADFDVSVLFREPVADYNIFVRVAGTTGAQCQYKDTDGIPLAEGPFPATKIIGSDAFEGGACVLASGKYDLEVVARFPGSKIHETDIEKLAIVKT